MKIKSLVFLIILSAVFCFSTANAQTVDCLSYATTDQQITCLTNLIAQLTNQINIILAQRRNAQPVLGADAMGQKAVDYINSTGLSAQPATLISASDAGIVFSAKIKIGNNQADGYVTKDGRFFFPQAFILGSADANLSVDSVANKAIEYINTNHLSSGTASLISARAIGDLVQMKISIEVSQFDSYITKDGQFLFPQAFDMTAKQTSSNSSAILQYPSFSGVKTSSPVLEAYVVSRCPFGLQMQRAMADAVERVPEIANYLKVRYIGSILENKLLSMHGDVEAQENLRQICIREEQPTKYWPYVSCQMKSSGTESACEQSTGIDSAKLSACVLDPQRGIAYAKQDISLDKQYNILGSPTLVINGVQILEGNINNRSSNGISSMVCSAFIIQPSFCSQTLNTATAGMSFLSTYSSSGSASASLSGSCGQ